MANRIQTIKDHSDVAQWQYVPSKSNPADYGSRGLDGTCLAKVEIWHEGRSFFGSRVTIEKKSYNRRN